MKVNFRDLYRSVSTLPSYYIANHMTIRGAEVTDESTVIWYKDNYSGECCYKEILK